MRETRNFSNGSLCVYRAKTGDVIERQTDVFTAYYERTRTLLGENLARVYRARSNAARAFHFELYMGGGKRKKETHTRARARGGEFKRVKSRHADVSFA